MCCWERPGPRPRALLHALRVAVCGCAGLRVHIRGRANFFAAYGVPDGPRRDACATPSSPAFAASLGTHDSHRGCRRGLHAATRPYTCHLIRHLRTHTREKVRPARGFRRLLREKVRPARPLHRVIREKVRPTRLKTAFFCHFGLAGRTFSRSHPHQAAQGE